MVILKVKDIYIEIHILKHVHYEIIQSEGNRNNLFRQVIIKVHKNDVIE